MSDPTGIALKMRAEEDMYTPTTGRMSLCPDLDGTWYTKDSDGVATPLTSVPQTLSLLGLHLSISDGNSVLLPLNGHKQSFLALDATLLNEFVNTPTPPYLPPTTSFETLGETIDGKVWRLELKANKIYAFELLLVLKKLGTANYHEFEIRLDSSETCGQQMWLSLSSSSQIKNVTDISDMVSNFNKLFYSGLDTNFAFVYEEDSGTPYEPIRIDGLLSVGSTDTVITVLARNITRSLPSGDYPAIFAQGSYMKATESVYP